MTLDYKQVTIRKSHQCFSCFRQFNPGTILVKWAGTFEGDFCHGYICLTCEQIMNKQPLDSYEEGYAEGHVHEQLNKNQTPEEFLETLSK